MKSNSAFWAAKVLGNTARDRRSEDTLRAAGWRVLTIWECETLDEQRLAEIASQIRLSPIVRRPPNTRKPPARGKRRRTG